MRRPLVLLLVFQFAFPAPLAYSQDVASESVPKKITCAVFEIYPRNLRPEYIEEAADRLREELRKTGMFQVLESVDISRALEGNPQVTEGVLTNRALSAAYLKAKNQYYNFEFRGAIRTLDEAMAKAHNADSTALDRVDLIDVHLLYALLQRAERNPRQAREHFRAAARLDPERQLSKFQYSPQTIQMFEEARGEVKAAAAGRLEITSVPEGANVWVNGSFRGVTPLTLESFPEGRHDLILARKDFRDFYTTVDLRDELKVDGRMVGGLTRRQGNVAFHEKEIKKENLLEVASLLGSILRVDKVIFLEMEDFAWNKKITGQMIDVEIRASHKPAVVQIEEAKDAPFAMEVMAKNFHESAKLALKSDPHKYTDKYRPEEAILLGPRAKDSMLKKPLFWVVTGVVLAGIGTGVGLAAGSGGGGSASAPTTTSVSVSGPISNAP